MNNFFKKVILLLSIFILSIFVLSGCSKNNEVQPLIKNYEKLLNEGKLACVPGTAFGSLGEGYMRISYCYSDEVLKEAFDRLEQFLKNNFPKY